jgi:hypothetical protein
MPCPSTWHHDSVDDGVATGSSLTVSRATANKKADVAEHPKVFVHVGLLYNQPPGVHRVAIHPVTRLGSRFARAPLIDLL